jgi:hypothetical protein
MKRTDTKSTRGNFRALVATSLIQGINDYYLAKAAEARGRLMILPQGDSAPRSVAKLVGWLESDEEFPFSFVWSCAALELDPCHVRERVKSFRSRAEMLDSITSKTA